jgi:YVTN family beta-propeller protein
MKIYKLSFTSVFGILFCLSIVTVSCENNNDGPKGLFENGIFITNEGTFNSNNGSVSFYAYGADSVINNVFSSVNGRVLGDVVQSLTEFGNLAFVVVNNSNKVELVNRFTFQEQGAIENLTQPRYLVARNNKAYVSCWDNTVKVVDLTNYSVINSINVGSGPERMLIAKDKLFVANGGAFGTDSTISVIDLATETVVEEIPVHYNAKSLVIDKNGSIWALCAGKSVWVDFVLVEETPSMLYKIDAATNSVVMSFELFENAHPKSLYISNDGSTLYHDGGFMAAGIYSLTIDGSEGTMTKIIDKSAYGFAYDSSSDVLFVCDAGDYVSAGSLMRYSTAGSMLGKYTVGVVPNGASFKKTR